VNVGQIPVKFVHTPGTRPVTNASSSATRWSRRHVVHRSCGRVDLPGSDPKKLYESLDTLGKLPDRRSSIRDTTIRATAPRRSASRSVGTVHALRQRAGLPGDDGLSILAASSGADGDQRYRRFALGCGSFSEHGRSSGRSSCRIHCSARSASSRPSPPWSGGPNEIDTRISGSAKRSRKWRRKSSSPTHASCDRRRKARPARPECRARRRAETPRRETMPSPARGRRTLGKTMIGNPSSRRAANSMSACFRLSASSRTTKNRLASRASGRTAATRRSRAWRGRRRGRVKARAECRT